MGAPAPSAHPRRVLHVPPTARDGQITTTLLGREGVDCMVCRDLARLAAGIEAGIGALLVTEEVLGAPGFDAVLDALGVQPPWSDLPVVMLMRGGPDARGAAPALPALRNLTLLSRPAPARSIVSAVMAALRARERQYQIRDQLEAIREAGVRLRESEARFQAVAEERQRLLESERAARAELEEAARMKDEFLATLSHELRTPLNAILGWSQMLRRKSDQESLDQGLVVIERNARVQVQLIEDLLDMSRIIAGKLRLNLETVDPASFVHAAIQTIEPAARAKDIDLRAVLRGAPAPILGDPDRLQQVVWNLLSNAVKFTPESGWIEVRLVTADSHVVITVADSGPGIDPEFLPFLFERFRQGDASTTRRHRGLGIGLAIVRHLVESHGGSVAAANADAGGGAVFTVTFPVLPPAASDRMRRARLAARSTADADGGSAAQASLRGLRVLVVDDEPDAREVIRHVLESSGARVLLAASADEAIGVFEREIPDVLLSDIAMPGTDGYALLVQIRALGPDHNGTLPALALTAFAHPEDRARVLRAGFVAHVPKPVEPRELVAAIAKAAAGRGQPDSD